MSANAIKAGEIAVEASVTGVTESQGDLRKLAQEIVKVGKETQTQTKSIAKYTKLVSGLVAFGVVTRNITALGNALKGVADRVDGIAKAADRMNVSVKEAAQIGTIASLGGADLKAVESGINAMNRQIGNFKMGSSEAQEVFANLGVTLEDIQGKGNLELFEMFSQKIGKFADESDRAAMRMKVFGKSGNQLVNVVKDGAGGIDKMRKGMEELGIGPTQDMVEKFVLFKDLMTVTEAKFISIKDKVMAYIVPAVNEMLIGMIAFADTSSEAFNKLTEAAIRFFGTADMGAESFSLLTAALDMVVVATNMAGNSMSVLRIMLYAALGVLTKIMSGFGWVYDKILSLIGLETQISDFLSNFSDDAFNQVGTDIENIKANMDSTLETAQNFGMNMQNTEDRVAEIRRLFSEMGLGIQKGDAGIQDMADSMGDVKDEAVQVKKAIKEALDLSKAFSGQAIIARGAAGVNASRNAQMAQWTKYLKIIAKNTEDAATIQGI